MVAAFSELNIVHAFFYICENTVEILQGFCLHFVVSLIDGTDTPVFLTALIQNQLYAFHKFIYGYGKHVGQLKQLLMFFSVIGQSIVSAEEFNSNSALMTKDREDLDGSYFAGGHDVGATAGTKVGASQIHKSYIAFKFFF